MAWWKKALIGSVVWIVLIFAVVMVHTSMTKDEKTTPEQDAAISRRYGQVFGAGLAAIWVFSFMTGKNKSI